MSSTFLTFFVFSPKNNDLCIAFKKNRLGVRRFLYLLIYLGFGVALVCDFLHYEEESDSERDTERKADVCVLHNACDDVHHEGDCCYADSVGNLGGYVVKVVTLTAGTGHNGGVRDR